MRAALHGRNGKALGAVLEQQLANFRIAALAADDSARYIAANALAVQLTGYSTDEITQLSLDDITPLPSTVDARALWRDFIDGGTQRGEFELRTRSGVLVPVHYWAYASVAPGLHLSLLVRVDRG